MTDDSISPAVARARRTAYAKAMRKIDGEPSPTPVGPPKWVLPPLSEFDEFGFPVDGGDSVMIAQTNTPDPQARITRRPSGRALWRSRGR